MGAFYIFDGIEYKLKAVRSLFLASSVKDLFCSKFFFFF